MSFADMGLHLLIRFDFGFPWLRLKRLEHRIKSPYLSLRGVDL